MPLITSDLEQKFSAWAKSLSATEGDRCANAEKMITDAIRKDPILANLDISVFPQGSYVAETNVRLESDVDIAVRFNPVFGYQLPLGANPMDFGITPAAFSQDEFKNMVEKALVSKFGRASIIRGKKAFDIHENTYRVSADAVPCFEHRLYTGRFFQDGQPEYHSGIRIKSDDGKWIVNWPHHALENGKSKQAASNNRYKSVVRILKKLKYEMAEAEHAPTGEFPSFLIQSLVWNVPNTAFQHNSCAIHVQEVVQSCWNLLQSSECVNALTEENGIKPLFDHAQPWTVEDAKQYLQHVWAYCGFKN